MSRPAMLLDWDETPLRVFQAADWKLRDRGDSTNRLTVTTSLAEAKGVRSEQEVIFKGRRFAIEETDRERADGLALLKADEVQAELNGPKIESYEVNSWTLEEAAAAALEGTRWTLGNVQHVRYGRSHFEDITVLDALKFLARHQGARLSFDSLRRRVNITPQAGKIHEIVFTYGRQLSNIRKVETAPRTTTIHPTGADGLTVASVNGGSTVVEDYGYYLAQGMSLAEARQHRKEDYWEDSRYTVAENLLRDSQARLAEEAYPQISYTLTAAATTSVEGADDFDLGELHLGDQVYVWDEEIEAKLRAEVTEVTTSSDATANRLTLAYLPESLDNGIESDYFGDSGRPADGPNQSNSVPQPRPSMPILVSINNLGNGKVRWNGQDEHGDSETIPERFGTLETRAAKLLKDGSVPSPESDDSFSGTVIETRGGGVSSVSFGIAGEYAVWFRLVGRNGQAVSAWSEPLMLDAPELVDSEEIRSEVASISDRVGEGLQTTLTAALTSTMANLQEFRTEWDAEWDPEAIEALSKRQSEVESTLEDKAASSELPALESRLTEAFQNADDDAIRAAQDAKQIAEDAIEAGKVRDTRDANEPPEWYYENYANRTVVEFKSRSTMGVPSGDTYIYVTSVVPWKDDSGGPVVQTATSEGDAVFTRRGYEGEDWSEWVDHTAEAAKTAYLHRLVVDDEVVTPEVVTERMWSDLGIFDRLRAREGWIGGVALEGGAITADKVDMVSLTGSEAFLDRAWIELIEARLLQAEEALIGGALLKDESISVGKLMLVSGNMVTDPNFLDGGSAWSGGDEIAENYGPSGETALTIEAGTNQRGTYLGLYKDEFRIPVQPGNSYRFSVRYRPSGSDAMDAPPGSIRIYGRLYPKSGGSNNWVSPSNVKNQETGRAFRWHTIKGIVDIPEEETNTYLVLGLYVQGEMESSVRFISPTVSEAITTSLVAEGAIKAPQIDVDDLAASEARMEILFAGMAKFSEAQIDNLLGNSAKFKQIEGAVILGGRVEGADVIGGTVTTASSIYGDSPGGARMSGGSSGGEFVATQNGSTIFRAGYDGAYFAGDIEAEGTIRSGTSSRYVWLKGPDSEFAFPRLELLSGGGLDPAYLGMGTGYEGLADGGLTVLASSREDSGHDRTRLNMQQDNVWSLGRDNIDGVHGEGNLVRIAGRTNVRIETRNSGGEVRIGTNQSNSEANDAFIAGRSSNGAYAKVWTRRGSYSPNVYQDGNYIMYRSSSLEEGKIDIDRDPVLDLDAIKRLNPTTFRDRGEMERGGNPPLQLGLIAQDVEELGLTVLNTWDEDGSLLGVAYDRVPEALILWNREQETRLDDLEAQVKALGGGK